MSTEDKQEWHIENCPTCRSKVLEKVDEDGTPSYRRLGEESVAGRMSVKEFRELGYLQEVNRRFLHPLGLALEVVLQEDGTETFGGVWDSRDDPEGFVFGPNTIEPDKAKRVYAEEDKREAVRKLALGYIIQPVE